MNSIDTNYRQEFAKLLREISIPESDDIQAKSKKYGRLNSYIKGNMPKSLFRYRTFAPHNIKALRNGYIPVTKPSEMGDIFDSQITVNIEQVIDDLKKMTSNTDAIADYLYDGNPIPQYALNMASRPMRRAVQKSKPFLKKNLQLKSVAEAVSGFVENNLTQYANEEYGEKTDVLKKTGYIACFCEDVNRIKMWDSYSEKHTGYALEYDFEALNARFHTIEITNKQSQPDYIVLPVIYGEQYNSNEIVLHSLMNRLLREKTIKDAYIKHPDLLWCIKGYLYKSNDYETEAEWRLITPLNGVKRDSVLYSNVPAEPTAIYYGAEISNEAFQELDIIAKSKGIKRYRMNIKPSDMSVEAVELDGNNLSEPSAIL